MKIFITSDIEGITTTTRWNEVDITNHPEKTAPHAMQMTREVVAACEGAIAAGADYILVNDAHDWGTNIDINMLPECCESIRGWSGHPYDSADGCDGSFAAAVFIGAHSPSGSDGSPLAHTMTTNTHWMKLNGELCSEFHLYSYACALEGVPTIFLSGDKNLCETEKYRHPLLKTVAVKEGNGGSTKSISPDLAVRLIREGVRQALEQDLSKALCRLPDRYVFEVCYKEHWMAKKMSYYPGFTRVDAFTNQMETTDLFDILRACKLIL